MPYILQPTRVTSTSAALIGNIFFNALDLETTPGNFMVDISDHLIKFLVIRDFFVLVKKKNQLNFLCMIFVFSTEMNS